MVLRIRIRCRRDHEWLLQLLLLFDRLGSVVGLRGRYRGVCVPIWSDLIIIAWFCGLVCRGGGGGGGSSLTRAL